MCNNNNEQQNPEAGAVLASMRITLEIKFAEKGVMMCVKSNDDDIEANGNDAAYVLRKMIAEQIGKASTDIIRNVCKSARFFVSVLRDTAAPEYKEKIVGLAELVGADDEDASKED
jgi:hypothetical protein